MEDLCRYSIIQNKNPREIVLLRGLGCAWKKCTFCDYHLDCSKDSISNYQLNQSVLSQVTGLYGHLEVINSGSFCELDADTLMEIEKVCIQKGISLLHFECHWMYRGKIAKLRENFSKIGVTVKVKTGVETFDAIFREQILHKGILEADPQKIASSFDECCLLFGLSGQSASSMRADIETGLCYFERVCINIMTPNGTRVQPDPDVIACFLRDVYPIFRDNPRCDILLQNTDFGVGACVPQE